MNYIEKFESFLKVNKLLKTPYLKVRVDLTQYGFGIKNIYIKVLKVNNKSIDAFSVKFIKKEDGSTFAWEGLYELTENRYEILEIVSKSEFEIKVAQELNKLMSHRINKMRENIGKELPNIIKKSYLNKIKTLFI